MDINSHYVVWAENQSDQPEPVHIDIKATVFEGKTILPLPPVIRKNLPNLALNDTKQLDRKWWLTNVPPQKIFTWENKVHTEADTQDIVRDILHRKFNNDELTKEMADWQRTQPIFYASAARCQAVERI